MDKKTKSPAVNAEQEKNKPATPPQPLNEEQKKRLAAILEKCKSAKQQRDQVRDEFDGLTYEQDYVANKRAANAYLWPKRNDDEVRVVTGTTEKKLEVLSNEVLSMNLQPEVVAYDDQDNEMRDLGADFADIVKRLDQMETNEDFDQDALRELITQRAMFFQDTDEYITINGRKIRLNSSTDPEVTKEVFVPKVLHRARRHLISGLRVYLGDINVPARNFQKDQPYIVIYTRRSYANTKTIYGDWKQFDYVKAGMNGGYNEISNPNGYRMGTLESDEVEELKIFDPINNEYDIILNGVLMMENSTPLPYEVTPWRRFNIGMVIIKSMDTDFAYGKPPVASAKTLQALNDETIRNLVRKFRQALEPPLGVATDNGRIYSKDIWEPGAVTQGVTKEDFSVLNPENQGVTASEQAFYKLINDKTEEFIGAGAILSGQATSGDQTAEEIQTLQRNAIKNLGHIVAAYMRYKRDANYLRIYNVIENFTKPIGKNLDPGTEVVQDVFERFTINNADFAGGGRGKKIVQFMNRGLLPEERQSMFEYENAEERAGRPVRIRTINRDLLLKVPIFWYVTVNQQQREGSALSKVLFKDDLAQGQAISQITGRQMNADKVIDEFEHRWQVKDLFMKNQSEQPLPGQSEVGEQDMNDLGKRLNLQERSLAASQLSEGERGMTQRPSLTQMMKE